MSALGRRAKRVVDAVDRFQRKHSVIGFPLAVIYKYFDDQGAYLSAIIAYYAFLAIFPLMLIGTSVLGFVLDGNPGLRDQLLDTALSQFPIIGNQLGRPDGLTGSPSAILIGSLAATYGAMGLGQAAQNAANIAWSVPRNNRANPILMRFRSLLFLGIAGIGILLLAGVSSVLANPDTFGTEVEARLGWLIRVVGLLSTAAIFAGLFKLVSGGRANLRSVLPGAVVTALLWQLLQLIGNTYVREVIGRASQMNGTFALVLGLMVFIFVAAIMVVFGLEVNVVLRRHLYPRALLTPFTDRVDLTDADRKAYAMYVKSQRHKGFQTVDVTWEERTRPSPEPDPEPEPKPAPVVEH